MVHPKHADGVTYECSTVNYAVILLWYCCRAAELGQTTLHNIAHAMSEVALIKEIEESDCVCMQLTSLSKGSYYTCMCITQIL